MRYLVTGGAGFIGSHLVEELISRGHEVTFVDNLSTGSAKVAADLVAMGAKFIQGDLRDLAVARAAVRGCDFVLHQAALGSVPRSIEDPVQTNQANVTATLNVLLAARDAGVRRVVYAGSSSVYGDTPVLPKREDMVPRPKSPYAVSKLAGEEYCKVFHSVYGLETVVLRYFNVFGPRQRPTSQYAAVIPKFIALMIRGEPPVVNGDGTQSRDFTFVRNNVEANLLACEKPGIAGEVFNIACGERHSLLDLISHLNNILGTSLAPVFRAPRAGDVRESLADIGRARELLGYRPSIGFEEGLQHTVAWYLEEKIG